MTKQEAIAALKRLDIADNEVAHSGADDILLEFLSTNGHADLASAWQRTCEECGGFWYA
jgi:hypothetical protein